MHFLDDQLVIRILWLQHCLDDILVDLECLLQIHDSLPQVRILLLHELHLQALLTRLARISGGLNRA